MAQTVEPGTDSPAHAGQFRGTGVARIEASRS